jgi:hypothetical protein
LTHLSEFVTILGFYLVEKPVYGPITCSEGVSALLLLALSNHCNGLTGQGVLRPSTGTLLNEILVTQVLSKITQWPRTEPQVTVPALFECTERQYSLKSIKRREKPDYGHHGNYRF